MKGRYEKTVKKELDSGEEKLKARWMNTRGTLPPHIHTAVSPGAQLIGHDHTTSGVAKETAASAIIKPSVFWIAEISGRVLHL